MQLEHVGVGRRDSGETIHLPAVERPRIVDGAVHAVAEFLDPVGQDRDAALAGRPVAGRQIVQHLHQVMLLQLLAQLGLVEIVGEEIFDAAKTRGARGGKAVDERHLGE